MTAAVEPVELNGAMRWEDVRLVAWRLFFHENPGGSISPWISRVSGRLLA